MKKRLIIKNESNVFFRKHPLGFTILQKKAESFEPDDQYVFFHGQPLLPPSAIEGHGNKLKSKKLRGLKKNAEKGRILLKQLGLTSEIMIANPRYEECYFHLENSYFSITSSGEKIPPSKRFNSFVTNGCLFGTHIQGIQADGKKIPLVDHHLKISSPIQDILVENEFHLYEHHTFNTLKRHIALMKKVGEAEFFIIYHLPVIDYILSAIFRFIRREMNFFALKKYVLQVQIRARHHQQKLQEIARTHQVNISVISPFDNLWDSKKELDIHSLLSSLEIKDNLHYQPLLNEVEVAENQFINKLIFLLENNEYAPDFKKIWRQLIHQEAHSQTANSLKDILSIGNASVIAYATLIEDPLHQNKTCVWLSADEYPVFAHYKRTMSKTFGDVICFSFLPSLLNYVGMNKDGSGQQTLFRYLPDVCQISVSHDVVSRLSRKPVNLSPDNAYIRTLDCKLFSLLYFLHRNHFIFMGNFPPQHFYLLYQMNENYLHFQTTAGKKTFIVLSKNDSANKSINGYVLFGHHGGTKNKFKISNEKQEKGCCLIL